MLSNQIRVLLQRVYNGGRKPKKIIMSAGLREALRAELGSSGLYVRNTFPKEDIYNGVVIVVAPGVDKPMIELEPLEEEGKSHNGIILPKKF